MHNYHESTNALPKPAITDKDGKPLLSWRVAILPYLEQQELYNKFHVDEPWDSPHNKALIKEMPTTYACPSRPPVEPGMTHLPGLYRPRGALRRGQGHRLCGCHRRHEQHAHDRRGEGGRDLDQARRPEVRPGAAADGSLYGAFSLHPGGFNAGFADGSVRFIKLSISPVVFKALITRNGGEVISSDQY